MRGTMRVWIPVTLLATGAALAASACTAGISQTPSTVPSTLTTTSTTSTAPPTTTTTVPEQGFSLEAAEAMEITDGLEPRVYRKDDLVGEWTEPFTDGIRLSSVDVGPLVAVALKSAAIEVMRIDTDSKKRVWLEPPYELHPVFEDRESTYAVISDAKGWNAGFSIDPSGALEWWTARLHGPVLELEGDFDNADPFELSWIGLSDGVSVVHILNSRTGASYLQTPRGGAVYFDVPTENITGVWYIHGLSPEGDRIEADMTTIGWVDGCSASEMDPDRSPQRGLPVAVEETRLALIDAAAGCDYEALVDLLADPGNDSYWWTPDLTAETLEELDIRSAVLGELVEMFSAPYGSVSDGDGGALYSWPNLFLQEPGEMRQRDIDTVASILGIESSALVDGIEIFPGYAYFRIGIDDRGRWLFALAGD